MEMLDYLRGQERIRKGPAEGVKERYSRVVIDLGTARTDEEINISGDYLAIASTTGGATTTHFKLNHRNSRSIYPAEIERLYASYKKIYLTNSAESGKELILYVGGALSGEIKVSAAGFNKLKSADGTTINPAKEDGNLETCMTKLTTLLTNQYDAANDTIMLRFNGTPYSTPITSTNAVQRFNGTNPKKLADVVIHNMDAANAIDIGVYNATPATLRGASFELAADESVGFTNVDLYQLGIISSVDGSHAVVHVLGVESY